jgi:hypothetical protein
MHAKHGVGPSTHPKYYPDLWLEARTIGGPDRNRVCNTHAIFFSSMIVA